MSACRTRKSFVIPSKINSFYHYSGIDELEHCIDKQHFKQYPHEITYQYNGRGFRDEEWPTDLHNAAWCIGDSYTVGVGNPRTHVWPYLLEKKSNLKTINVSMDGASNNWIARKAIELLNVIQPTVLILHWSFINRREEDVSAIKEQFWQKFYNNIKDNSWPSCPKLCDFDLLPDDIQNEIKSNPDQNWQNVADDNRLIHFLPEATVEQDIDNTLNCISMVDQCANTTKIIHSFVPEFLPAQSQDLFFNKLVTFNTVIDTFPKFDLGRDGSHYGVKTAEFFVDKLSTHLK